MRRTCTLTRYFSEIAEFRDAFTRRIAFINKEDLYWMLSLPERMGGHHGAAETASNNCNGLLVRNNSCGLE